MVFIAEQCEGRPVKSRMAVFQEIFSMTDSRLKNMETSKPWVGWRLTFGEFHNCGSKFVEQRGQSGVISNQERFK